MKKEKNILKSASLLTGAILTSSLTSFAANETNAEIPDYSAMGSGAEVRSEIMNLNAPDILHNENNYKFGEGKCGEGKCGEGKSEEEKEKKKKEAKKTEGKKAEDKKSDAKKSESAKKEGKKKSKEAEGKTPEAKCGEGKCG